MWTTTISLPVSNSPTQDADGFRIDDKEYLTGIPANKLDATRDDDMLASQSGYNADIVMEVDKAAYSGQSEFIDESDGVLYSVKRSFLKNKRNVIQLIGEKRQRGKVM